MALTKAQANLVEEIKEIAKLVGVDHWNLVNEHDSEVRSVVLKLCRDRIVRAGIVFEYVLLDELLTDIMCQQFFDSKKSSVELWKTRRFQNFNYFVVEELSLLKKLALVRAIRDIPKNIRETIKLTNVLRNAVAHSFFPMNKREFKRTKKVTYKGKDVFTLDGMKLFNSDVNEAVGYLIDRAFGKRRQRKY